MARRAQPLGWLGLGVKGAGGGGNTRSATPALTVWPLRSSLPLPCQVTSAVCSPLGPNTTQAWSSDRARWTSRRPRAWQAPTTAKATPELSSLVPVEGGGNERGFSELWPRGRGLGRDGPRSLPPSPPSLGQTSDPPPSSLSPSSYCSKPLSPFTSPNNRPPWTFHPALHPVTSYSASRYMFMLI